MTAAAPPANLIFVLVHGAWHGGWCWRRVARRLTAAGCTVFAPTLTGLGERAHLLSPSVGLDTFIADVLAMLESEELGDVVLVGHSFAGAVISGVADRAPERLTRLIYLDGLIVGNGESPFDQMTPDVVAARREAARQSSGGLTIPVPAPEAFGVADPADQAWLSRRLTPHPLKAYEDRLMLRREIGAGLPKCYITCTDPYYPALASSRARVTPAGGWDMREIKSGHDVMVTAPGEIAELLLEVAAGAAAPRQ